MSKLPKAKVKTYKIKIFKISIKRLLLIKWNKKLNKLVQKN